jgi:predicted metal-dependent peptidase
MLEYRKRELKRKLQLSRNRLKNTYPDITDPLYLYTYVATKDVWRISTNGSCIFFNPDWVQKLSKLELDFIHTHILLHILFGHINRPQYYKGDRYHLAADVVVNGHLNILGWNYDKLPHIGKIRYSTFFPSYHGTELTSVEAIKCMPVDPSTYPPAKRRQFLVDSDEWWDRKDVGTSCGTVVLSPYDDEPDDLDDEKIPFDGDYIYKKLEFDEEFGGEGTPQPPDTVEIKSSDDKDDTLAEKRLINDIREDVKLRDDGYGFDIDRPWHYTRVNELDWKNLLHSFIQEERFDYSFTPPDRRLQDLEFFVPDYNTFNGTAQNVLFMVDTSGSISDETLSLAYGEIYQALEQFDNSLNGTVGFFDTRVHRIYPFNSISDINKMKPVGSGGTSYEAVFQFVEEHKDLVEPSSIVIITDGEGTYPDYEASNNIPVLWLLSSDKPAPWGESVFI